MGATGSTLSTDLKGKVVAKELLDPKILNLLGGSTALNDQIPGEQLTNALKNKTDVFLTHNWGPNQDNHKCVAAINDALKAKGLLTWFDSEKMGDVKRKMTEDIDNASCVVVFVTQLHIDKVRASGSPTGTVAADGRAGICVSRNGTLYIAGGDLVTIWDNLNSSRLSLDCSDVVSICINSNGSRIVINNRWGGIRVYSDSGLVIGEVAGPCNSNNDINSLSMNATGSVFASGSEDHLVKLWDASTLKCIQTLDSHTSAVKSVSFSPNNNTLISGDKVGRVKVWA